MPTELKMPALSPTMEEGTLAKWLVKEGDVVKSGDLLAEIETDKATMEFEAVDEGTVTRILVAEGTDGVKVGTVIALIAGEGEDASPPPPAAGEGGAAKAAEGEGEVLPPAALPRSARTMRPLGPLPFRVTRSIPCASAKRRAKGEALMRSLVPLPSAGEGDSGAA